MSKYVKELMMDQLRSDLDGSRSVLIVDLKGLDAVAEHRFRNDLRKKSIRLRVLKNTLARRVFEEMGLGGLASYLEGPSVAVWGGDGVAELAKPTLNPGETVADLKADRSAFEDYDAVKAGERGYGFVRLNQLAVEHLLGAR